MAVAGWLRIPVLGKFDLLNSLATTPITISATREEWLSTLATEWDHLRDEAMAARGQFIVALSGGSTPGIFYRHLACDPTRSWDNTVLLLGDERTVPCDHPESNARMAREAFAGCAATECLRPWNTDLPPAEAAVDYSSQLCAVAGTPPVLDLSLLGIGTDGHTASLFPGTRALTIRDRWATENEVPQLATCRLTLTYPCLSLARHTCFLLAGADKSLILDEVRRSGANYPSSHLQVAGSLCVYHCLSR